MGLGKEMVRIEGDGFRGGKWVGEREGLGEGDGLGKETG